MKIITFINFLFLFATVVSGQETVPELEIEKEYRIIGKDTRVFTIIGDRKSTIEFNAVPLILQEEQRNIESSEGLISENERLLRKESFIMTKGLYAQLDYLFGAHTTNNVFGKASFDSDNIAAAVKFLNCSSKENTPDNAALISQEIEAVGYYDASDTNYSLALGFSSGDDDALNRNLRPGSHEVNRYRASFTLKPSFYKSWNPVGQLSIKGGTFMNYEDPADISKIFDKDEFIFDGGFSVSKSSNHFVAAGKTAVEYLKLDGDSGTLFSTGLMGDWLFMNAFGLGAGADLRAHLLDRLGQRERLLLGHAQQVEGEPVGRLAPDARQAGELADEIFEVAGAVLHALRVLRRRATSPRRAPEGIGRR